MWGQHLRICCPAEEESLVEFIRSEILSDSRGILTWTEVNSQHPRVLIRGDKKENLTGLAAITASGDC
jgi:hypothetical protein